ncbi:MAG: macro domain-containing protein [Clostridia bacterium]|jgi:O-acetyl-ADP-ribose deacetylase (regulator of RNase III)
MIILFDMNKEMCDAWNKDFKDCNDVKVLNIKLDELHSVDYLVTAGNSYGIMNGGIDLAVRNLFGIQLQDRIQWSIIRKYKKLYLPVGDNIVVHGNNKYRNIIYAPTMASPKFISKDCISKIFLNCLLEAKERDIACCGLGALAGGLSVTTVSQEMKLAYDKFKR